MRAQASHPSPNTSRYVETLLEACPPAGSGVHNWLFRAARAAHHLYPDKGALAERLTQAARHCGRQVPEREIADAIRHSLACAWNPDTADPTTPAPEGLTKAPPKWPSVDQQLRERVIRDGACLYDLWDLSPVRYEDDLPHSEQIIDALFPGNPLLCVGRSTRRFATRPRDRWRGRLSGLPLVVPSPMIAVSGLTKDRRISEHCLDNTGVRRFLVVEFDEGSHEAHAALIWHLAKFAPLVTALSSGNKSLHAWFSCRGSSATERRSFFDYAIRLGADFATWSRCQFVRIPDGLRADGSRQRVFYFNPNVI